MSSLTHCDDAGLTNPLPAPVNRSQVGPMQSGRLRIVDVEMVRVFTSHCYGYIVRLAVFRVAVFVDHVFGHSISD